MLEQLVFEKIAGLALTLAGDRVKDWFSDVSARRALDNAVKYACRAIEARYPDLTNEFFDQVFIEHNVAPQLLAEFLDTRGQLPTPERITQIWGRAYGRTSADQERMLRYAVDFIDELGRQIAAQKALRQYVSQARVDRAVELLDDLAAGSYRQELEEALDRLMDAALAYEDAAVLLLDWQQGQADADRVRTERRRAEWAFQSARRRLQRMEYIAAASLLADFEQFVRSPFFGIEDQPAGTSSTAELAEGVTRMAESLAEAP